MPTTKRLSRWERARCDWQGVQGKRELAVAGVGAVISAAGLLLAGFPHDAAVVGVSIVGSAVALAVIVPAAELYWSWLQAPMRLLTDEVFAIRERLDQHAIAALKTDLGLRPALMNHKRVGDELVAEAANYGMRPSERDAQVWTNAVIDYLGARMPSSLEEFMMAGTGSSSDRMSDRLQVLEQVLKGLDLDDAQDGPDGPPVSGADEQLSPVRLSHQLQDLLRRGQDCRSRARISSDGSSGPLEVWEQEVVRVLAEGGRHDLALRFEHREVSDQLRGFWSGAFETRKRVDRELNLLADFARELEVTREDATQSA